MITKIKAMVQSRRFWLGVAGTIVAFSNALFVAEIIFFCTFLVRRRP